MFTKTRTVQPAIGIDLTWLQVHTALTPTLEEGKNNPGERFIWQLSPGSSSCCNTYLSL